MSSSIWLMCAVKVPLVLLIALIIWWASRAEPDGREEPGSDDDGGIRRHPRHPRHPRRPFPRHPRRGPHGAGGGPVPPPARTRSPVRARARPLGHR